MMTKFYVGQKVTVTENHPEGAQVKIGDIVKITEFLGVDGIGENYAVEGGWLIHGKYLSPITEAPETITINGVEYIRKPEPEHEWKFGDVAVHEKYGVGIVTRRMDDSGCLGFDFAKEDFSGEDFDRVKPSSLTFLRRADLSV